MNTRNDVPDDLSRDVYCILGIPVDVLTMQACLRRIRAAVDNRQPFLLSTPNLNYLVRSRIDFDFRNALVLSDLCLPDGMPIVWLGRLLGIPIKERVAGSDIFEALEREYDAVQPLKIFFFGGLDGIAAAASMKLNARDSGLVSVGSLYPGFGSLESMSSDDIISKINSSNADFLVVALGAEKGQLWLAQNHDRLTVPIRSHLGAVVNFVAGTVRRAPVFMRRTGFEWLWRISQEPHLWRRYWNDGRILLQLIFTAVIPAIHRNLWHKNLQSASEIVITQRNESDTLIISISGPATFLKIEMIIGAFKRAQSIKHNVLIDLSGTTYVDTRMLGVLLMLRKQLKKKGGSLKLVGASSQIKNTFSHNKLATLFFDGEA